METHRTGEMTVVPILLAGVAGRMGRLLAAAVLDDPRHVLRGASARSASPHVGGDVGTLLGRSPVGVCIEASLRTALASLPDAERASAVLIDFSAVSACAEHAALAAQHGVALLVGTTGLGSEGHEALRAAGDRVPVLQAANTSLGANLLEALVKTAAHALPSADIEIVELHHGKKRDAPSGTALLLAERAAAARQASSPLCLGRSGVAPREAGEIGVHALRGGDVVGEHAVHLLWAGERVELVHRVTERSVFAVGALAAARFLAGRRPGRYTMSDVLDLSRA